MADTLTPEERSRVMSLIRGKDTKPERAVRSLLHRMGYRFRLHRRDLPGSPDIVLPRHRTVVFVHGCFWHRHPGCRHATTPATRRTYWLVKFERNVDRDQAACAALRRAGWRVITVWECALRRPGGIDRVGRMMARRLSQPRADPTGRSGVRRNGAGGPSRRLNRRRDGGRTRNGARKASTAGPLAEQPLERLNNHRATSQAAAPRSANGKKGAHRTASAASRTQSARPI